MATILGPDGHPIQRQALHEPQTAHYGHLQRELQTHPTRGLTPSKLAAILEQAEGGDLLAQFDLFEDMEEKDGHVAAELGKRRRAILVDWSVVPPDNPSAAEKRATERIGELLGELPDMEDVLFDVTDAIGKGFACLEIEWHQLRLDGQRLWLPKTITHRPQSWFVTHRGYQQQLRLRSNTTVDGIAGEPLQPFGWITHIHKAKSGYIERAGLLRQLVWPYLFKNYSVGDLAEFLEIYGIPVRVGKYPASASEKEKMTLLRALVGIGHNAAGIIPEGMGLDFMDAARGDPQAFELMINWCERTQSKVILGGTLTSGADGKSSTNALGKVHNEVRKDLRDSDIRQICATLTRDLIYPIAAVNGLAPGGLRRCPSLRLNVGETEDLTAFAQALPSLVSIGMQIPVQWAQEKLGIPQPEAGEAVLQAPSWTTPQPQPQEPPQNTALSGAYLGQSIRARHAALTAATAQPLDEPLQSETAQLATAGDSIVQRWVDDIARIVQAHANPDQLQGALLAAFGDLPTEALASVMGLAFELAQLQGMDTVRQQQQEALS